jgi:threonine dehydratase
LVKRSANSLPHQGGNAERIIEVRDNDIADAIRICFSDTHTLTEGAGAAPLAALMKERDQMQGRRIGLVLSRQTIDRAWMHDVLVGETPTTRGGHKSSQVATASAPVPRNNKPTPPS